MEDRSGAGSVYQYPGIICKPSENVKRKLGRPIQDIYYFKNIQDSGTVFPKWWCQEKGEDSNIDQNCDKRREIPGKP